VIGAVDCASLDNSRKTCTGSFGRSVRGEWRRRAAARGYDVLVSWAGRVIAQAEAVRPIEVVEGDTAEVGELLARAHAVAERCAANASAIDHEGAFPTEEFGWLADAGLLAAPLGREWGRLGLGIEPARTLPTLLLLRAIGRGNLAVGRLYEGHVNAL